jgi:hypothetical protein
MLAKSQTVSLSAPLRLLIRKFANNFRELHDRKMAVDLAEDQKKIGTDQDCPVPNPVSTRTRSGGEAVSPQIKAVRHWRI